MIDVFVDRCFSHNFDPSNADDAFLVRRIALLNEVLLDTGLVKPTMMLAYFVKYPVTEAHYRNRSALTSVRDSAVEPAWLRSALADFARILTDPDFAFRAPDER